MKQGIKFVIIFFLIFYFSILFNLELVGQENVGKELKNSKNPFQIGQESIVNASNLTITKVGEWGTGPYNDVFISGNYAYCAAIGAGLDIIDISDPSNPNLLGNYNTWREAYGVYVSGNYAYVADGSGGLKIIDISNPTSPTLIGSCGTSGSAYDVYVSGGYAYVANVSIDSYGLKVIDITDPTHPLLVGSCYTSGSPHGVFISGNYAYVADGSGGLKIIDISNPTSPTLIGSCDTSGWAYDVYVSGGYAYVADGECAEFKIINISEPTSPYLVGSCYTSQNALGVYICDNYAYVADNWGGIKVIDITDPTNPILITSFNTQGNAQGVYINRSYAYVANGVGGLKVLDISYPTSPKLIGTYDHSGNGLLDVFVSGNYAYAIDDLEGLKIIDISDPTSPALVACYDTSGSALGIYVSGGYAYVADASGGLKIIDVRNTTSPTLVASYDQINARDVFVYGNYAYAIDYFSGLKIIDISDPTSPALIACYDASGSTGIYVSGGYAYITDGEGLKIIDITDPTSPTLVGRYDLSGGIQGIYVNGNYAYLAADSKGLKIIDISNPTSPYLVGEYFSSSWKVMDVYVSGNYAYLAAVTGGLQVINLEHITLPTLIGSYDTSGWAYGVYCVNNLIYLADYFCGKLYILENSSLEGINVVSPNGGEKWPRGSTQNISWTSSGLEGDVTIDLYKGGVFYSRIGSAAVASGNFSWRIPSDLPLGNDYKVRIYNNSISDYSDNYFSISDYLQELVVTSTIPKSGEENVPVDTAIEAYFNQELDPSTVNQLTVNLYEGANKITVNLAYDNSTKCIKIKPTSNLLPGQLYTVILNEGIRSKSGINLSRFVWSFKTITSSQRERVVSKLNELKNVSLETINFQKMLLVDYLYAGLQNMTVSQLHDLYRFIENLLIPNLITGSTGISASDKLKHSFGPGSKGITKGIRIFLISLGLFNDTYSIFERFESYFAWKNSKLLSELLPSPLDPVQSPPSREEIENYLENKYEFYLPDEDTLNLIERGVEPPPKYIGAKEIKEEVIRTIDNLANSLPTDIEADKAERMIEAINSCINYLKKSQIEEVHTNVLSKYTGKVIILGQINTWKDQLFWGINNLTYEESAYILSTIIKTAGAIIKVGGIGTSWSVFGLGAVALGDIIIYGMGGGEIIWEKFAGEKLSPIAAITDAVMNLFAQFNFELLYHLEFIKNTCVNINPLARENRQTKVSSLKVLPLDKAMGESEDLQIISVNIPYLNLDVSETAKGKISIKNNSAYSYRVLITGWLFANPTSSEGRKIISVINSRETVISSLNASDIEFTYSCPSTLPYGPEGFEVSLTIFGKNETMGNQVIIGPIVHNLIAGSSKDLEDLKSVLSGETFSDYIILNDYKETSIYIPDSLQSILFCLHTQEGGDADLHLYDSSGNHIGLNYSTGEIENQIRGAEYSGDKAKVEYIKINCCNEDRSSRSSSNF